MALRWRKAKKDASLITATRYELRDTSTDEVLMHVQAAARFSDRAWFYYGLGVNTATRPHPSLEEAKAEAMAHAKKQRV